MADPEQIVEGAAFEGRRRLERSWPDLIATGLVGGIDISVGLLALLVVLAETDNHLLSALAFGIGFIALVLARSDSSPRTSSSRWPRSSPGARALCRSSGYGEERS